MTLPIRALAPRFDPRRLANCLVWLDGSDASTLWDSTSGGSLAADGVAVGRWEDKSGNGNNATQSTASSRPLRRATKFAIGSLDFDGANDRLVIENELVTTSASIVIVSDKDGSGQISGLHSYSGAGGVASNNHHGYTSLGNFYDGFCTTTRQEYSQTERLDQYVYATTTTAGGVYTAYFDGVQKYTASGRTVTSMDSQGLIGAGQKTGNYFFDGWISEVLIYSRALSASEIYWLYLALRGKWGAT